MRSAVCLLSDFCLLVQNSAIRADMTLLMQYKVVAYEKILPSTGLKQATDISLNSETCYLSSVCMTTLKHLASSGAIRL